MFFIFNAEFLLRFVYICIYIFLHTKNVQPRFKQAMCIKGELRLFCPYSDGLRAGQSGSDSWQCKTLLYSVRTDSGVHSASYSIGTGGGGGSFNRTKAAGVWSWPLISIQWRGQESLRYSSTSPCLYETVFNHNFTVTHLHPETRSRKLELYHPSPMSPWHSA
jgi:hypothetical protein